MTITIVLGKPPVNSKKNTLYFYMPVTIENTENQLDSSRLYRDHETKEVYKKTERELKDPLRVQYKDKNGINTSIDANEFLKPGEIQSIISDIRNGKRAMSDKLLSHKIKREGPLSSKRQAELKEIVKIQNKEEARREQKRNKVNLPIVHAARNFLYLMTKMLKHDRKNEVDQDILNNLTYAQQDLTGTIRALTDSILLLQDVKKNKYKIKMREILKMRDPMGELFNYERSKENVKDQILFYTNQVIKLYNETRALIAENADNLKPILPLNYYRHLEEKQKKSPFSLIESTDKIVNKSLNKNFDKSSDMSLNMSSDKSLDMSLNMSSDKSLDMSSNISLDMSSDTRFNKSLDMSSNISLDRSSDTRFNKNLDMSSNMSSDKSLDKISEKGSEKSVDKSSEEGLDQHLAESGARRRRMG